MTIAVFSSKPYDEEFLERHVGGSGHRLTFFENRLRTETAPLAAGHEAVCAFVNDKLDRACLEALADGGTKYIVLRCAGFNNLDLDALADLGMRAARVPAYSPHAVAEHTLALLLALTRKTHKAYNRVREGNFSIDGLMGRDLHGLTAGIIGTGLIGCCVARIFRGFGCEVLGHDVKENDEAREIGLRYVPLQTLLADSDTISLHCPLTPATRHLLDDDAFGRMRQGAVVLNTSRGALIDAEAAVRALKSGQLGGLGLDVYEEEESLFFEDRSRDIIQDDVFMRLTTFPNVLITSHQAYFTGNAMDQIGATTRANLDAFEKGETCDNEIRRS